MATRPRPTTPSERKERALYGAQSILETARRRYRREYDRGYLLEQQGHADHAQRVLDEANRELKLAEDRYRKATER